MPRPMSSDQVPPGSEWDFQHLGAPYFVRWLRRCADDGLHNIARVYTGNKGHEYSFKLTEPTRVRPNFMADDGGADFRAYEKGQPKQERHQREHVIQWPYQDVVAFITAQGFHL